MGLLKHMCFASQTASTKECQLLELEYLHACLNNGGRASRKITLYGSQKDASVLGVSTVTPIYRSEMLECGLATIHQNYTAKGCFL